MSNNFYTLITDIKNGILIKKIFIHQKNQKKSEELLNILWDEGFILGYKITKTKNNFYKLKIILKYTKNKSVINSMFVISKPGLKVQCSLKQLWKLNFVQGLIIVSTNKGLKTISECKKLKVGGELLLYVT